MVEVIHKELATPKYKERKSETITIYVWFPLSNSEKSSKKKKQR